MSFWPYFEALLGLFLDHSWAILGPFYSHFAGFFGVVCEVACKIKQNDAREGKDMQKFAKIHQKYAKSSQKVSFFAYKTLGLLKNGQNRRFNLRNCAVRG